MILAVSIEQPPEPQHEAALSSLSWRAMALYFSRTMSFICSVFSMMYIFIVTLRYYDGLDQKKCGGLSAAVVRTFVGGKQGADLFLVHGPCLRLDAVANTGALDGSLDQACGLQFLQVLGYGRLCQAQDPDQIAIDAGVGLDQVLDDGNAGGVRQGLHHGSQLILLVGKYFRFR